MNTVKMATLPKCDLCEEPARYDARLAYGTYLYVCAKCSVTQAVTVVTILEQAGPPAKPTGKKVRGKDLTSFERIVMDGDREIECPECGAIRMVEPDAAYTYTCEDCGVEVKVPCIM